MFMKLPRFLGGNFLQNVKIFCCFYSSSHRWWPIISSIFFFSNWKTLCSINFTRNYCTSPSVLDWITSLNCIIAQGDLQIHEMREENKRCIEFKRNKNVLNYSQLSIIWYCHQIIPNIAVGYGIPEKYMIRTFHTKICDTFY